MTADLTQARPVRAEGVTVERTPGGALAHRAGGEAAVALNPTALALWELCDGQTTAEEMVLAVCALFDVDEPRARGEVFDALTEMRTVGLVA
jgi:hypothetical protein